MRTGRPRSFDRDEAVSQAMALFWRHGYEATSLSALTTTIGGGITPPSFYAAFGSKEALFREVVDRYVETHGRVTAPLHDPACPPRDAVERALRGSARMQTHAAHPPGCLLVSAAGGCSPQNHHIEALLAAERGRSAHGFRACVERAIAQGALRPDTPVEALATALQGFLLGMTTQVRDGASLGAIDAGVSAILTLWDGYADRS